MPLFRARRIVEAKSTPAADNPKVISSRDGRPSTSTPNKRKAQAERADQHRGRVVHLPRDGRSRAHDNVYLPGIAKHFLKESLEERGHAELLMNYRSCAAGAWSCRRSSPQVDYDHPEKGDALYAFELSLSLEKLNNDRLIALHRVAGEADANMQDFIEGELLADRVKSIEEVSRSSGSSGGWGTRATPSGTSTRHFWRRRDAV